MNYIDGAQQFFGRGDVINLMKRRVIDLKSGYRQNIALLGNQYVGKSALLHYFFQNLDERDVTVIYLDLENKDFSYFVRKFIGSLLYNYSKNFSHPLHEDIHLLMESTRDFIPYTVEVIKKVYENFQQGKMMDTFLGLLTIPEIFTNETGTFCVLILDEFQNLRAIFPEDVFEELGKKIMTQKRCLYVVASSYAGEAQKILSEELLLLFGNFETIPLEPFDLKTSQEFISHSLRELKVGIQLHNFLTDFAGGHPLYLRILCRELINLCALHRQNEIYLPLISQTVENTIFDRWGIISRHFELVINDLCLGKGNQVIASILIALANTSHKVEHMVRDTGLKRSQITQRVNRLQEQGVIVKNGSFYYLKDKLFKYWIKYIYQRRLKDIELAPDKLRRQFKSEFHQAVESFKIMSQKDFSSRIMELFYCFENEAFELNGRRYKLPVFLNMVSRKLVGDHGSTFDVIEAKTDNAMWFIVIKKEDFSEIEVNAVIKAARSRGQKADRCLIISLTDLDENTKIRALQERFWIWNEGELNTLLNLFDKPYIV